MDLLKKIWERIISYPKSYDDYVNVGQWLVYKKLLVILAVLLPAAAIAACAWFLRPEKPYEIPVFYYLDNALQAYSGPAVLVDEEENPLYRGQISAGLRAGRGTAYAADGTVAYEGDYAMDRYHGQGRLYDGGALLYEGTFSDGEYSGQGVLYGEGGPAYTGAFAAGVYHGEGKLYDDGVLVYEGSFRNGLFDGSGTLYRDSRSPRTERPDADTPIYTGGFYNGLYQGQGTLFTPQGATLYEGSFLQGLYDGPGTLYDPDGPRLRYTGQFTKGRPSLKGDLYNARGQMLYTGAVLDGQPDYISLAGLPVDAVRQCVLEVPVIYYGGGFAGFLYRELGFAAVFQYDFSQLRAASLFEDSEPLPPAWDMLGTAPPGEGLGLFTQPQEDLVVNTLLIEGGRFSAQIPQQGAQVEKDTLTGFEAFMESRLARIADPMAKPHLGGAPEPEVFTRGDHLYEVTGLPETAAYDGQGVYKDTLYYFWRRPEMEKGSPRVFFCGKAKLGG